MGGLAAILNWIVNCQLLCIIKVAYFLNWGDNYSDTKSILHAELEKLINYPRTECDSPWSHVFHYFEILKFFHLSTHHVEESWLEVKNFKNLNRKVVFHPNIFFKIQLFLVITLIDGVEGSVCLPQGVYMKNIIEKSELFNLDFGCKTPLGSWFFEFFDSKKTPSLWAFHCCWKKISSDILKCVKTLHCNPLNVKWPTLWMWSQSCDPHSKIYSDFFL